MPKYHRISIWEDWYLETEKAKKKQKINERIMSD